MTDRTPAQLAADVRDRAPTSWPLGGNIDGERVYFIFASELAALVALAERAEQGWPAELHAQYLIVLDERDAAIAQADDLLRQRNELQNSIGNNVVTTDRLVREKSEGWRRALAAEARVAELETALREIADSKAHVKPGFDGHPVIVVRGTSEALEWVTERARSVLAAGSPANNQEPT